MGIRWTFENASQSFFLPQSDQYALLIKQHNRHGISGCESHSIHEANICESPHEVIFSFLNLHCGFNPSRHHGFFTVIHIQQVQVIWTCQDIALAWDSFNPLFTGICHKCSICV